MLISYSDGYYILMFDYVSDVARYVHTAFDTTGFTKFRRRKHFRFSASHLYEKMHIFKYKKKNVFLIAVIDISKTKIMYYYNYLVIKNWYTINICFKYHTKMHVSIG